MRRLSGIHVDRVITLLSVLLFITCLQDFRLILPEALIEATRLLLRRGYLEMYIKAGVGMAKHIKKMDVSGQEERRPVFPESGGGADGLGLFLSNSFGNCNSCQYPPGKHMLIPISVL